MNDFDDWKPAILGVIAIFLLTYGASHLFMQHRKSSCAKACLASGKADFLYTPPPAGSYGYRPSNLKPDRCECR